MKKNLINLLINITLLYIFIFIFIYSKDIKICILESINIWINNIIPSIFPFLIISNLLYNYGLIDFISKIFGPPINKIYNLPSTSSYALLGSIFTGYPTGAKYTKELLEDKKINIEDANHLITFTSFSNPLFVIGVIGETLLKNKLLGIKIFICHLISGLITGLLFKNKRKNYNNIIDKQKKKDKFIIILLRNINEIFKILINILGIMIFFRIVITIINKVLKKSIFKYIINGILEMTTGIINISKTNTNMRLKASLIGFLLSFGGISVHFQTKSIIEGTDIKYYNFFIARIIHSLLCFIIIFLFIN